MMSLNSCNKVDEEYLTISVSAIAKIKQLRMRSRRTEDAVRITFRPELPIEQRYQLEFILPSDIADRDVVQFQGEIKFALDPQTADLIKGTSIDYVEGMWSAGFRFVPADSGGPLSGPLAIAIQKVIREEITPMVGQHGGTVSLVDVQENRAVLRFGGGCQGCAKAPQTFLEGVERLLRERFPELTRVIDVTNHAVGENPYYATT